MKEWEDLTAKEIDELKQKQCRRCEYARFLCGQDSKSTSVHNMYCGFTEITGRIRMCSPINCIEFKKKRKRRKKAAADIEKHLKK